MQDLRTEELHHRVGNQLNIRCEADVFVQRKSKPRGVGDGIVKELGWSIGDVVSCDDVDIIPGFFKIRQRLLITVRVSTHVRERLAHSMETHEGGSDMLMLVRGKASRKRINVMDY